MQRTTSSLSGSDAELESLPLLSKKLEFRWTIVVSLCILMMIVTAVSELTWPFINQMIIDIGAAPDSKSVGFYSGLIETVASLFGLATIFPGSVVADWRGRKTVIYSTLLGTGAGQVLFGFSNSLFGLVVCRSIVYAFGPQLAWSTTVTVLGDLADNSNHSTAVAAANASYRLGQLISPIFVALLAHPSRRYVWFKSKLWAAYPYALPCLGGAVLCAVGVYIIARYLPETAPRIHSTDKIEEQEEAYDSTTPIKISGASRPASIARDEMTPPEMLPITLESIVCPAAHRPQAELFTPQVIQLLVSSWIMYFITISFSTLFPLWAFTPVLNGGLGASENTIGVYLSVRSVIHLLSLAWFSTLEHRLGVYRLYHYSLTIYAVGCTLSFPLLNWIIRTPGMNTTWIHIGMLMHFIMSGFGNYCTTCMVMMMNHAAPSAQVLSRIVGVSQSVLGIGQCMAPIVTLSVFEFSIKSHIIGGNLVWVFLFIISMAAAAHSWTLKQTTLNE